MVPVGRHFERGIAAVSRSNRIGAFERDGSRCAENHLPPDTPQSLPLQVSDQIVACLTGSDAAEPQQVRGPAAAPRLIRTPHEAVQTVAEWMR
ncbi:protein of unknown function [Blastococcus saxobsidens DD2]|uniref:Uncharacterized protein n=1 Tax=Blastococcus saxobsidens (strain DD2) TaxID=1146883 RepID=H6RJV8_BLASD|nr:protein of unknown function [Blastococcus saxobsidens DD2]